MSETNRTEPDGTAPAQTIRTIPRACDNCRSRKIRCDKNTLCSNCQRAKAHCTTSPRVARPSQRRALAASKYGEKFNLIDKRLERMGHAINTLVADDMPRTRPNGLASPTPSLSSHSIRSPRTLDSPSAATTHTTLPARSDSHGETQAPTQRAATRSGQQESGAETVAEGPSSLSAHSTEAIRFLHEVAGADRERGYTFDTRELLDSLYQIVDAIKTLRSSPKSLFIVAKLSPLVAPDGRNMPPIQAAVAVIRKAQDQHHIVLLFINKLLRSQSLSDLCLKVYSSQDYSDADFVIINVALYCLFNDVDVGSIDPQLTRGSYDEYRQSCQANIETALSELSLYIKPDRDMVLALILGAMYAVEGSKPFLAWTLVTAAYQTAYSLGCHTRAQGAGEWCDAPNPLGLLSWAIYFLEKTLCLRLGRCSAISDSEITVPLPGNTPAMNYCRHSVRLASLAGATYEKLYSAQALALPDEARKQRVLELSSELHSIQEQSRDTIQNWLGSSVDKYQCEFIEYVSITDEVLWLSMLTLIYRATPARAGSTMSFTDECVASARAALARHQSSMPAIDTGGPALLSSYINWTILFSPFIPFIVLFCHVLESGDTEDLARMQTFVNSTELASHSSGAIAKHHRLFQVFHAVALCYMELKSASTPSQDGQAEISSEMDGYLSALGFQPHVGTDMVAGNHDMDNNSSMISTTMMPREIHTDVSGMSKEAEPSSQLGNWYSVSQQMMGLLDSDQLPF